MAREQGSFSKGFSVTCGVLAALFFTFVVLPFFVCAGCPLLMVGTSDVATRDVKPPRPQPTITPSTPAVETPRTEAPQREIIFDIPALMGKSIDEIRDILGPPTESKLEPTELQSKIGVDEWSNNFENGGRELLVTFYPDSRKVKDFFIPGEDGMAINRMCNLKPEHDFYKVERVPMLAHRSRITGIIITPVGTPPAPKEDDESVPGETEPTQEDGLHVFKSDVGSKIRARIVAVEGDGDEARVVLEGKSGKQLKVKVGRLSEDDQERVNDWMESQEE